MMRSVRVGKMGLASLAALLLVLSACSKNNNASPSSSASASASPSASASASAGASSSPSPSADASLQPVDLTWYYPADSQTALGPVQDAVNKITKEKINATVTLKPIAFGEYNQRMNTIATSGEAFDIAWTANWLFDYVGNVSKGLFVPLDDLLNQDAAELKASLPEFMWDQVKVGGKIYGVPNYQSVTGREGYIVPKEYADKYGLDVSSIKKFEDIEPFLDKIKQGEKGVAPLVMDYNGMFGYFIHTQGISTLPITSNPPIGFYDSDTSMKLFNVYASPEYKHYLEVVRGWYQKGYINKDAPTIKTVDDLAKAGKAAVSYSLSLNPGTETIVSNNRYGGKPIVYVPTTGFVVDGNPGIATVNAIGKNAKNPDRAMMFLNLVNTDKELYNTLVYGVEGTNYDKLDAGTVKVKPDSGFTNNAWVMGNTFNGYLQEGQAPDTFDVQKKTNEEAKPTLSVGFKFDVSSVQTEIANVQSVLDEYLPGLSTGAVDPAKKLPDFLDRLQKAGIDKLMQEAQKQLDAWKATK